MTRKRFVKLLMGKFGYSRNDANDIACATIYGKATYKEEFNLFYSKLEPIFEFMKGVTK